jgi:hypothetical protein
MAALHLPRQNNFWQPSQTEVVYWDQCYSQEMNDIIIV